MFDASRLSFLGSRGLLTLKDAKFVVVGAGGGGSHIVQQLSHLAPASITVIDPDVLEASNVNRVVGATYDDLGAPKALILARRFSALGTRLTPIVASFLSVDGVESLQAADVVFGAVDNFAARNDIEAVCRQGMTPYIDVGLGITIAEDGSVSAAGGQIATSLPGKPCLRCMTIVTDARIAADRIDYANDAAPEQQVISMNGVLASEAVNIGIDLVCHYAKRMNPLYLSYDALRHTLGPHPAFSEEAVCKHYDLADAGWKYILPSRP